MTGPATPPSTQATKRRVCAGCEHVEAHHGKQELAQLPYDPHCQWRGCGCPRFLEPPPVQHHRVGPAKCACGYNAYAFSGIMLDYAEMFANHLASCSSRPNGCVVTPRLLDLFCGAGGCSVGYARAGFEVVGVDIEPHPDYPFHLVVADALGYLGLLLDWPHTFDAIHASPPCQAYTTMANRYRGNGGPTDDHRQLIDAVRDGLEATGLPYVIENVCGARPDMRAPIRLTGGMFGLRVERPRLFESNLPLTAPPRRAVPRDDVLGIYGRSPDGRRLWTRKDGSVLRAARSLEEGAAAMGIDWMTDWSDVTEAIPPAYTEWVGTQILDFIGREVAA